ncbi:MAG: excinuclease ABC subunit UvrA [Candidatus Marinimicrobia bacterium]|nr:excinuclease ABC subunit UvrA [Candidatus Neomarinimicrobiota bacterium]MCF7829060.1 excinuclease ABC subunit UvrA [Candidatus Neomarinimicrobiota bacterium]MCF7881803.1 excinuclease ABC subunit UvrA [Candidatus Neomarinimicrobiota bacterium]
MSRRDKIIIKGAREHNLKNIDVELPRNKYIVITGLSGSGKSSLAFDTIYAEGQRRYVESLSAYARQFLGMMEKPDVDYIEGLSPAISIEQKSTSKNPRSTVGTVTEIYDYLRLLYARVGKPYCYNCGQPIQKQTVQQIVDSVLGFPEGAKIQVLAPVVRGRKGEYKDVFKEIKREGFLRVRVDGDIKEIDEDFSLDKNKKHEIEVVVDRLVVKDSIKDRLTDSLETALNIGSGLVLIDQVGEEEHIFSEHFSCPKCEISYEELSPRMFSFNSPYGACDVCDGLGTQMEIDPELVVPDHGKSLNKGAVKPIGVQPRGNWYSRILKSLSREYDFKFTTPWKKMSEDAKDAILYGTKGERITVEYTSDKARGEWNREFEGVIPNLQRRYKETSSGGVRNWIETYMRTLPCPGCDGGRIRKEATAVKINGTNLPDLTAKSIKEIADFFDPDNGGLKLTETQQKIARQIVKEIRERLRFLINVGLDYLTLDRGARTLSGGEAQRIRLATQIGSQLVGVLYILDEPTIGLHQRDNQRLINTLTHLRDIGNTVIVVEHDPETIESADVVVDLGKGAGEHGGNVVAMGTPEDVKKTEDSITGQFLSGKRKIKLPEERRNGSANEIFLKGARGNNLKEIDVSFPLGKFICVTGVSGSGKSTLVNETLYPALAKHFYDSSKQQPLPHSSLKGLDHVDKVIDIDQSPIGRTPRSNPATYSGAFTPIRDLYSDLPESKIRGYQPGRFSFNVKGGRCEECSGDGVKKIEMHFLPDVHVTCEACDGKRYNRETLEIKYKGKNISQVLDMTVTEALEFFHKVPKIRRKLKTLKDVGLGYITLGQQSTTLSGGEAQRVKLATELSKIGTGNTMYILDEPTTGLHFADIEMLLKVLNRLVDRGNTVIVIEHNLDVVKTADHIIDLGPEGGDNGGMVVVTGTPEEVAKHDTSYTGKFLSEILRNN